MKTGLANAKYDGEWDESRKRKAEAEERTAEEAGSRKNKKPGRLRLERQENLCTQIRTA
jgi:hypothetical protein